MIFLYNLNNKLIFLNKNNFHLKYLTAQNPFSLGLITVIEREYTDTSNSHVLTGAPTCFTTQLSLSNLILWS